jgi:hypothetical protein
MSAVTATIDLLLRPLIITISDAGPCRSIGSRSRNCCGVDIGHPLLLRLVVGVVDDDYLAVSRRLEEVTVELAIKLSGELLITRSVNHQRRRAAHWGRSLRHRPAQTLRSSSGVMRHLMGIPVEAEIRMAPVLKFLHQQAEDFPMWKESVHA